MTGDTRDPNDVKQDLKYDHRNLLTGMRVVKKSVGGDGYETYQLMYNYDEAGNRVRKRVYFYQGEDPTPVFEEDDMTGSWDLVGDEYYVRDVSGKEIAVYHSYDLDHWNVWGTDNVGKINANGSKFFYIKDHLGSVRVVLNSDNQIVSAIDYDCWGYPLENRSYQSDDINYKFTGKQRDAETGYDYFGARYYDARIGRWGGVEPLLEKYISYSPYQYGLLNPMRLVDADGLDVYVTGTDVQGTVGAINNSLKSSTGDFRISVDKETGKLSCLGTANTEMEKDLEYAIKYDHEIKVNLITTQEDQIDNEPLVVGMYYGGEEVDGLKNTYQYFNLSKAPIYEQAGGSDPGKSAIHEILESYTGGKIFKEQKRGYNEEQYLEAHKEVVTKYEKDQYHPKARAHGLRTSSISKVTLVKKDGTEIPYSEFNPPLLR